MLFLDMLIAYAPSPVKPLLHFARGSPMTLSLGLVALGLLVVFQAGTVAKVTQAASAAKHQESAFGPADVAVLGGVVAALGAVYPGFVAHRSARRVYVLSVHRESCDEIRAALEAMVLRPGGLLGAAVRYRGVVIDFFDTANAVPQVEKERIEVSVAGLRAEYYRLAQSIDVVVRLCTEAVRETRQGHMHRLVLDVLHGGILYEQVLGRTYLMGCVVDQSAMESVNGELPRAYCEMKELAVALRTILGRDGGRNAD